MELPTLFFKWLPFEELKFNTPFLSINRCLRSSSAVSLFDGTGSKHDSRKKMHYLLKFGGKGG